MVIKAVKKAKNPPMLSHEFVIQNHADIVSCVAMVFVLGLMFQVSAPIASVFVTLSHNATSFEELHNSPEEYPTMPYTNGIRDVWAIFFYSLIVIIIHAVIQEYFIDKVTKKMHLSKTKLSRFNESGQMLFFSILSTAFGIHILIKDSLLSEISSLWIGYPGSHAEMSFAMKFYCIIQIAYWLHCFPELYFQKVKRDEVTRRVHHATLNLLFISAAYIMNFTRVGLVLFILRFVEESVLNACRLLSFAEKTTFANTGFKIWNILFVCCRLLSFIITILTFHYGLATLENQDIDFAIGNFNSPVVRLSCLVGVVLVQAWMMWSFIHFHLKRKSKKITPAKKKATETKGKGKKSKKEDSKRRYEDDVSMLPESEQNSRKRR